MSLFKLPKWFKGVSFSSELYDDRNFYQAFLKDIKNCKKEIIIESPFITSSRIRAFYPVFKQLISRNVCIYITTRDPIDYDDDLMRYQSTNEILCCNEMGINITLIPGNHHRKLAILDREILWEGSLNILSYSRSKEIMRRIEDEETTDQMIRFLKLEKLLFQR